MAPDRNERLTATTGAVLFLLLAGEGVTILFLRPLFPVHVFVGMLLIPPVALKLASTGWRFLRYYGGSREYVEKGPPLLPLRLLAPLVVASTAAVLGTGIALIARGPGEGLLVGLHKGSFVVWLGATGVHVLAHLRRVPRLVWSDLRRRRPLAGARTRLALVAGAVAAGALLATATVPYAHPWEHWLVAAHHHDD